MNELIEETSEEHSDTLIEIKDLSVTFDTVEGTISALDHINLEIKKGETLGILGESGSGKSTLALSIMSLIPENGHVKGEIVFGRETVASPSISGEAVLHLKRRQMKILSEKLRNIRWKEISMVFQGSMNAFNPVYTIYRQIAEVYRLHTDFDEDTIRKKVIATVRKAGLNPIMLDSYPHELSGGMKQRAVIAMALALNPSLVIADEPTTGLDVITQAKIISELKDLVKKQVQSMIVISHDIGVVSQLSERIVVLYAGRVMEIGRRSDIFDRSANPYTRSFLDSYPSITSSRRRMSGIPGSPPNTIEPPPGCRFAPRCRFAKSICFQQDPPLVMVSEGHHSACHFAREVAEDTIQSAVQTEEPVTSPVHGDEVIMRLDRLTKYFDLRGSLFGAVFSGSSQKTIVRAVDEVSFDLRKGEIFGIVGESGSGKTTLGRTVLSLLRVNAGSIKIRLPDISALQSGGRRGRGSGYGDIPDEGVQHLLVETSDLSERDGYYRMLRRETQMIFQDPYDSLDPKMTVFDIVREPVIAHRAAKDPDEVEQLVRNALAAARLTPPENFLYRYPHELSGGERQRVAAARALVLRPEILVADEPISMLDVSLRAGFMNLLLDMRNRYGVTIIYITHDIASARYVSDRIMVLYLGVAVELGNSEDVIRNPLHPYTKALIQAVPLPTPGWNPGALEIVGEIGNAVEVPAGCRFTMRCPYREKICAERAPPVQDTNGHWYLCHFSQSELLKLKEEKRKLREEAASLADSVRKALSGLSKSEAKHGESFRKMNALLKSLNEAISSNDDELLKKNMAEAQRILAKN